MEGILLVDKPEKMNSFGVVAALRRRTGIQKIGHGGTLDPFATGLLIMLISRSFTKRAGEFLEGDKEYRTTLSLGCATDTYDKDGTPIAYSDKIPSEEEVREVIARFQGPLLQIPPMFSAKKIAGVRLYEMARKGQVVERASQKVHVSCRVIRYEYPELELHVCASKGTYIRTLGFDIGNELGCLAHLSQLRRCRSGRFCVEEAISMQKIGDLSFSLESYLRKE